MTQRKVKVEDNLQTYTYILVEPMAEHFDKIFLPELTPREMLKLGVFGGNYFENAHGEFPEDWFSEARLSDTHDYHVNYFNVDASQSREEWRRKGWLSDEDPRGWFQWYCRYYMGRRIEDDERQIKRWKNMRRHVGQVANACRAGDELCRPRQRQALLHWAYDSRKI